MSAPPVSYVTPLPTNNKVCSIGPSGVYVSQITLPSWRGITEAARLTAAKHGYSFSSTSCPLTTSTETSVPLKQCSTYSATLFNEIIGTQFWINFFFCRYNIYSLFLRTYLGAAVLSGSDLKYNHDYKYRRPAMSKYQITLSMYKDLWTYPPTSLQTFFPSSIAAASSTVFGNLLSSPTKIPKVFSLIAFSGTPSRISNGTYNAFKAPSILTNLLASKVIPFLDSSMYKRGFLQPEDNALAIPFSVASANL